MTTTQKVMVGAGIVGSIGLIAWLASKCGTSTVLANPKKRKSTKAAKPDDFVRAIQAQFAAMTPAERLEDQKALLREIGRSESEIADYVMLVLRGRRMAAAAKERRRIAKAAKKR